MQSFRRLASVPDPLRLDNDVLAALSDSFEDAPAEVVVRWAVARFGRRLTIAASMTDAVLIHLAASVHPGIEVVFVDTGYHFEETLRTAARVADRYPIKLRVARAHAPLDELWRTDPDACCHQRKVVPLDRALHGKVAWMSGLRRAEAPSRANTPIVHREGRGLVKVNPLATWSDERVEAYIAEHDIPVNPLLNQGYPSIGCWPCTKAVAPGDDVRAGRWSGWAKTECGLHL